MAKTSEGKVHSHLTKDIKRIRKHADYLSRINQLRKYQVKLIDEFLDELLREKRITKEELKKYMPRKKDSERKLFGMK